MKIPHRMLLASAVCLVSVAALVGAGKGDSNMTAKVLWIYPYGVQQGEHFQNATVMEKTPTGIKFKVGDHFYEHCGHYTIEN